MIGNVADVTAKAKETAPAETDAGNKGSDEAEIGEIYCS